MKDKLSHTQVLNQRLLDDIDFIKKHGPLVKEKLEFERNIMNQINTAQQQVRSISKLLKVFCAFMIIL